LSYSAAKSVSRGLRSLQWGIQSVNIGLNGRRLLCIGHEYSWIEFPDLQGFNHGTRLRDYFLSLLCGRI